MLGSKMQNMALCCAEFRLRLNACGGSGNGWVLVVAVAPADLDHLIGSAIMIGRISPRLGRSMAWISKDISAKFGFAKVLSLHLMIRFLARKGSISTAFSVHHCPQPLNDHAQVVFSNEIKKLGSAMSLYQNRPPRLKYMSEWEYINAIHAALSWNRNTSV